MRELVGFWAKLERDEFGHIVKWHSVEDHSADVAACFQTLLELPIIRQRLARVAGLEYLSEVQCARLGVLAALHDIGKFNHGFQNKAVVRAAFTCGHVRECVALFDSADAERLAHAIGWEEIAAWGATEDLMAQLLVSAICHHGRPQQLGELAHQQRWWSPANGRDPLAGVAALVARIREWFPLAFQFGGEPLPCMPELQHAFNGVLTLADWMGSDISMFPLSNGESDGRFQQSIGRARDALLKLGLDVSGPRRSLGSLRPRFAQVSTYVPNSIQLAIAAIPASNTGGLTIIESETGSGKTEAALMRFMTLFHAGLVDGMYFALPTRTAATQIHTRVVEAIARAFPCEEDRPAVVLAVPGYLSVDDRFGKRLSGFEVRWDDDARDVWRFRGWAAERPKRYLAAAIAVGTIDQVLLSTLQVPHAHLRSASLFRHLLVVDEVHASDTYMTALLEEVVKRHVRAGGHALLMSATLGGTTRAKLMQRVTHDDMPPLASAVATPYPLISHADVDGEVLRSAPTGSGAVRRIRVEPRPIAAAPAAIAAIALEAARQGARVLIIRNTVRDCIATQLEVEHIASESGDAALLFSCDAVPAPHHSRFARPDRQALDHALELRFGKDAEGSGCIAVATQTVQQSLDIDADFMLSDICPVDVLLQRLGRLQRHSRNNRPSGYASPWCYVLTPHDRDLGRLIRRDGEASRGMHGIGTVYTDLLVLEATWRLLDRSDEWVIPDMNRELVESAVHPEALAKIADELGEAWRMHAQQTRGVRYAHLRLADLHTVDWSLPFGEFSFPSREIGGRIATRLGNEDRVVEFSSPFRSPFGNSCNELTMPWHMVSDAGPDATPLDIETAEGYISFRFGSRRYNYDRLGLRMNSDPKEHESDNPTS